MLLFWTLTVGFMLGALVAGSIRGGFNMGYETRDDCGNKMNEKQTLDYLVKGQRIQLQFLGKILNILLLAHQDSIGPEDRAALQEATAKMKVSREALDAAVKANTPQV